MTQIKIINAQSDADLEYVVNETLKELSGFNILDIKVINFEKLDQSRDFYEVMIIYEK